MKIVYKLINFFTNLYFLCFLNGILIASILYFKAESTYEKEVYGAIAKYITRDSIGKHNRDTFFIRALNLANSFEHNRLNVFGGTKLKGIKANVFRPSTMDLLVGNGACGSASVILSRILKSYGFVIRFAQMKVNGKYGGHIVIEVKKDKDWIVMDPLYNLYFKDSLGNLASFETVKNNINYYKKQFPVGYNQDYMFEGVRYTNWNKIKIFGPMAKSILDFFLGKDVADEISLRAYIVRIYEVSYKITVLFFIPIFLFTLWKFCFIKIRKPITK
jgi:hypothetical protein